MKRNIFEEVSAHFVAGLATTGVGRFRVKQGTPTSREDTVRGSSRAAGLNRER
jgi:hypothetical protein